MGEKGMLNNYTNMRVLFLAISSHVNATQTKNKQK